MRVIAALLLVLITGCGNENATLVYDNLIGTWQTSDAATIYVFNADKSCSYTYSSSRQQVTEAGTCVVQGTNTVVFTFTSMTPDLSINTYPYDYEVQINLNGDQFTEDNLTFTKQ